MFPCLLTLSEIYPRRICLLVHVGIVYALGMEAGALEDRLKGVISIRGGKFTVRQGGLKGRGVVVIHAGVGQENAAAATETLIAGHRPQWIISAGLAGGLHAGFEARRHCDARCDFGGRRAAGWRSICRSLQRRACTWGRC